jgi:hypothetical protein
VSTLALCGLVALALSAVLAPATRAATRVPVDNQPLTTSGCGFAVLVTPIFDNEMLTETTLADGTIIDEITGRLVNSFTNVATGKTIVRNVSGPNTTTIRPDGTLTLVGTGRNWFGIGPQGQANTQEPGLVVTSGRVVVNVDLTARPPTVTGFGLDGTQENLCAILAP